LLTINCIAFCCYSLETFYRTKVRSLLATAALPTAFLALTAVSFVLANSNPDATPFTTQEVVWAARGGYLGDLVHHFMKNGGL
jgi:hypothetical protein